MKAILVVDLPEYCGDCSLEEYVPGNMSRDHYYCKPTGKCTDAYQNQVNGRLPNCPLKVMETNND